MDIRQPSTFIGENLKHSLEEITCSKLQLPFMEMADVIRETEPLQKRSLEQIQNKSSSTVQEDVIRSEDLQVSLPKPIVLSERTSYSGAIGSTMVLQCQIEGDADTVLWKKRTEVEETYTDIEIDNKKYIGGSIESPSLVLISMGELDVGTYVCQATNSGGTAESSEIKVSVTDTIHDNVSVLPAMFNQMVQIAKESATTVNMAIFHKVQNSVIGNDGFIVNQSPSDSDSKSILEVIAEKSRAAKLIAERYVEAYGKITAFNILSEPDIREVKVQFTADDKEDPCPNLQQILQKQISKALNVDARIVNIELIKHCIIVSFDITGASLPWEMSALSLAERFCNGLRDGSIRLTNESGNPLSIRMESTNIQVKASSDNSDAAGVPIVSIGQGGYIATAGGITILTCTTLSSTPISTVKWYRINKEGNKKDAIKIDNKKYYGGSIQAPSLVINHTDDDDGGLYLCRAENKNGTAESRPTYLLVYNDDDSQLFVNAFRSLCPAGTPESDIENPSVVISSSQQSQQHDVDMEADSSQIEIQKMERSHDMHIQLALEKQRDLMIEYITRMGREQLERMEQMKRIERVEQLERIEQPERMESIEQLERMKQKWHLKLTSDVGNPGFKESSLKVVEQAIERELDGDDDERMKTRKSFEEVTEEFKRIKDSMMPSATILLKPDLSKQ